MRHGVHLRTAIVDSVTHELRTPLTSIKTFVSRAVTEVFIEVRGVRSSWVAESTIAVRKWLPSRGSNVSSGCSWCVPSKPSTRLLAALHARVSIRIPANHQAHHVGGCYAHAAAACV